MSEGHKSRVVFDCIRSFNGALKPQVRVPECPPRDSAAKF